MVRRAIKIKDEHLDLQGDLTLRSLLEQLVARHGSVIEEHVFDGTYLSRASNVLVDGVNCQRLGGLDAPLGGAAEIEVVVFGPPLAGG
jgi:hypothetical protein